MSKYYFNLSFAIFTWLIISFLTTLPALNITGQIIDYSCYDLITFLLLWLIHDKNYIISEMARIKQEEEWIENYIKENNFRPRG
jgi:hypothetical protein